MSNLDLMVTRLQKELHRSNQATRPVPEAPRDGQRWTGFEEDTISDHMIELVGDLSRKFGRTENAIVWKIYRMAKEAKR